VRLCCGLHARLRIPRSWVRITIEDKNNWFPKRPLLSRLSSKWVQLKAAKGRSWPPPSYAGPRNVRVLTLHDPTTVRLWESFIPLKEWICIYSLIGKVCHPLPRKWDGEIHCHIRRVVYETIVESYETRWSDVPRGTGVTDDETVTNIRCCVTLQERLASLQHIVNTYTHMETMQLW